MTRPAVGAIRPAGAGAGEVWPWLLVAGAALLAWASTSLWLGGKLAAAAGPATPGPRWSLLLPVTVARHGGLSVAWPGVSPAAIWLWSAAIFLLPLTILAVAAVVLWRRRPTRRRVLVRSLARPGDVTALRSPQVATRAIRLRPSLAQTKPSQVKASDRGVTLGRLLPGRTLLQSSWEDVLLAIFAPRSGKTTAVAVPAVLDAPGAVVATSNKPDLYLATHALRAEDTGQQVWVFDPQAIAHVRQEWWWNPLGGRMSMDDAERLAGSFVLAVTDEERREIWGPAARELLANLFLAAHYGRLSMLDAYTWLFDEHVEDPVRLLREHGETAAAASLDGTQGLNPETRSSVYFTARSATASLRDQQITRWVTPRPGLPQFDPAAFAASRQTLYLLSKGVRGGTTAASLVAALTNEVRVAAERAGEQRGGRLDPPMLLVLDEVANICRIADLPEQYSHLGSRSIVPIAILQSYAQGERVWGKAGMRELWGASTIKLIGSGADDADFAEDISRIIGDHEINTVSLHHGPGGANRSISTRRDRIIPAADLRALPKSQAVLLATGTKPALIELLPWYRSRRADRIETAAKTATGQLVQRAEPDHGRMPA